jgi:predicted nuclease of predicted toxin-antitoxin system
MVDPVADLLMGRGHPVVRARDAGLADAEDWVIAEYAQANASDMVVVTFDIDFRNSLRRRDCRCLHIRGRERTARARLADYYREVVLLIGAGQRLVTLPSEGPPVGAPIPAGAVEPR